MNFIISLLQAQPMGFLNDKFTFPIIMVSFVAFFYFFIVRPQNKKRKETENMLGSIKKGDKIITIGGIHGKVVTLRDNEIVLRVDSNTELTFEKAAISRVVKATGKSDSESETADKKEEKK